MALIPEGNGRAAMEALIDQFGEAKTSAWLAGARWTDDTVLVPHEFSRARVDVLFGAALGEFGFAVAVGENP